MSTNIRNWLVVAAIFLTGGLVILRLTSVKATIIPDTPVKTNEVSIKVDKPKFKQSETVAFTITNNTLGNIFYYPETCASKLAQVFIYKGKSFEPLEKNQIVCLLAPGVSTLSPEKNLSGSIPVKEREKMKSGKYQIKFEYSTEKVNQFSLGGRTVVESETFSIE